MTEHRPPPRVGDKIVHSTPPFLSTWEITRVTEHGVVMQYAGDVEFVGYNTGGIHLPQGTVAAAADEAWMGAAHWPSLVYVERAEEA